MDNTLFAQVDEYISRLTASEDHALQAVTQSLKDAGIPDASVSASQGKLLQVLAMACGAKRILELGSLGGYSSIWLARALPEGGKLISLEYDPFHAGLTRKNLEAAGLASISKVRQGPALDLLPELEKEKAGPFDLVFIDADKEPYLEYFRWAIRLGRPGTIIIADNVIRGGRILDPNSRDAKVKGVQRLNEELKNMPEVSATILQTVGVKEHDGMVVAVVNNK